MPKWTEAEIEILRKISSSTGPLKRKLAALPGRSYTTVKEKARALGLNKERVSVSVLDVLSDGVARTSREISDLVDRPEKGVWQVLLRLSAAGSNQQTHVQDLDGACGARRYVIGKGKNACVLVKVRTIRVQRTEESVIDRKFRSNAAWWPHGDPVVIASINAMVSVGRVSA